MKTLFPFSGPEKKTGPFQKAVCVRIQDMKRQQMEGFFEKSPKPYFKIILSYSDITHCDFSTLSGWKPLIPKSCLFSNQNGIILSLLLQCASLFNKI